MIGSVRFNGVPPGAFRQTDAVTVVRRVSVSLLD